MSIHKLGTSISTIPNQSKHYYETAQLTKSHVDLRLPYKNQYPLKFPKNKTLRKKTMTHMLTQTHQNPEKSSIRNYHHSNRSSIFDPPGETRRILKNGAFQSLSRQSIQLLPLNRSTEDIGIINNRKKYNQQINYKADPIVVGQKDLKHNSALQKVWVQPRRHRDNGKLCSESMVWKNKPHSSYLQLYKNKQNGRQTPKISKFSILN